MSSNTTKARQTTNLDPTLSVNPVFVRPGEATEFDKFTMPEQPSLPETAYQIVHDEAILDGNSRLNLATFVGTWMDDEAKKLYLEAADKNMIDKDEYPATAAIEDRCWRMLADLWNVPDVNDTIGTSTIGSSEACMLGGLALKRLWQEKRKAEGKSTEKPNLIMSAAVEPDELYTVGTLSNEFHRTVSRIIEMQSKEYLDADRRSIADSLS